MKLFSAEKREDNFTFLRIFFPPSIDRVFALHRPVPGTGTLPVVVQRRKRWSLRLERNPPSETIPLQFYAD